MDELFAATFELTDTEDVNLSTLNMNLVKCSKDQAKVIYKEIIYNKVDLSLDEGLLHEYFLRKIKRSVVYKNSMFYKNSDNDILLLSYTGNFIELHVINSEDVEPLLMTEGK